MGPFALFLPRRKKEEDAEWGLEGKFPLFLRGLLSPKKHLSIFCAYDSGAFLLRGKEQDHFCVWEEEEEKKNPLVLPPTKKEREERVDCFQKVFVFRPCFFLPEMIFLFAFSFPCPSFSFFLLLQCFCFQKYPPPVYSQTASAKKKTQRGNSRLRRRESDFFFRQRKDLHFSRLMMRNTTCHKHGFGDVRNLSSVIGKRNSGAGKKYNIETTKLFEEW